MKRNIIRTALSLMIIAAMMIGFGATAFADSFKFEIPENFNVSDVIIKSAVSGDLSIATKFADLYNALGGEKVAENVAYDRYCKGEDWEPEFEKATGYVIFGITGPTTILFPSKLGLPVNSDVKFTVICVDIPDGIGLEMNIGGAAVTGIVKDGKVEFIVPAKYFDGMEEGDDLSFIVKYTVDGVEYTDESTVGFEKAPYYESDAVRLAYGGDSSSSDPSVPVVGDDFHGIKVQGGGAEMGWQVVPGMFKGYADFFVGKTPEGTPSDPSLIISGSGKNDTITIPFGAIIRDVITGQSNPVEAWINAFTK